MMADYVNTQGYHIRLTDILNGCNKKIANPPRIRLKWAPVCVLGAHPGPLHIFDNCQFKNGHIPHSSIPNKFAKDVVAMLTPGANAEIAGAGNLEGPLAKRQHQEGQQEPDRH